MLTDKELNDYRKKLEEEKDLLETELGELGKRNPSNQSDWVPAKADGEQFGADRNDNADIIEDMVDSNATLNELEGRLTTVVMALDKIKEGTFGLCEISGEAIENDRLQANPAARTCKAHMNTAL